MKRTLHSETDGDPGLKARKLQSCNKAFTTNNCSALAKRLKYMRISIIGLGWLICFPNKMAFEEVRTIYNFSPYNDPIKFSLI